MLGTGTQAPEFQTKSERSSQSLPDVSRYYLAMDSGVRSTGSPGALARLTLLLALLAAAIWGGAERMLGVESWYYDILQRLQAQPGSEQIVLVETAAATELWDDPGLPALLRTIADERPAAILPLAPALSDRDVSELNRLAAVLDLEQRARGDRPAETSAERTSVAAQLAQIREEFALRRETIRALGELDGLVIAVGAGRGRGSELPAACETLLVDAAALAPQPAQEFRSIVLPPATICRNAAALGHIEFWPEARGIVRTTELMIGTGDQAIASAGLSIAARARFGGGTPEIVRAYQTAAASTGGPQVWNRYYAASADRPAFRKVDAAAITSGELESGFLADRIVIIGTARDLAAGELQTPLGATSVGMLVATNIANLLNNQAIGRPPVLAWIELMTLALLCLSLGLQGSRLSSGQAALFVVVALPLLLGAEAYLLHSRNLWVHYVSLAIFVPIAIVLTRLAPILLTRRLPITPTSTRPGGLSLGEDLDMAFSVLRQQPPTADSKFRLYNIAMQHGRNRDFARAERVLRYIASVDPGYRDVAQKLEKISGPVGVAVTSPDPGHRPPARSPAAGGRLGRYQLEGVIGRGAMATVYLGLDPTINRRVAIKTLPLADEFADSDLREARSQFLREAESAGRLNHPYIITIYDAGEDHGIAYLAMEYFDGKPLSYYSQNGRLLDPTAVVELMARAADALHYAHGQRVVHRDVKPANLLYHRVSDTLKLTDFGIARLTDTARTKTGIILGTPSYMSPEQLSGTTVTGQTDLYSLGATMYHLLAGAPPFLADSIPGLMEKIVTQQHRPIRDLRDDVPPGVDEVLDRALAKRPSDRFPDGRSMALALRDCCSSVPARAQGSRGV